MYRNINKYEIKCTQIQSKSPKKIDNIKFKCKSSYNKNLCHTA